MGYLRKVGAYSRIGIDYQFKNRVTRERRQPEQPAAGELECREVARRHAGTRRAHAELDEGAVGAGGGVGGRRDGCHAGRSTRRQASQTGPFSGQVVSASGAGGAVRPPTRAIRWPAPRSTSCPSPRSTPRRRMTASAIYAPPYPAEAFDEPLEDAIRLRGAGFPQATTDARGNFVVATVPDGKYFVHVTPDAKDAEHLPGGDVSRRSYTAEQLRGQSMTISSPAVPQQPPATPAARPASPATRTSSTASRRRTSSDGPCRGSPATDAGLLEASRLLQGARVVSGSRRLHGRHAPRIGGLRRHQRRRQVQAARATATRACRSRPPMPTSTCGGTRPTASTSSRW